MRTVIRTIQLSAARPRTSSNGGWTAGDMAEVFLALDGSYGFCLYGVGFSGLTYETDDETGFDSPEAAEAAAREYYRHCQDTEV